jgi:uncharacterized protein (TIGR03437 family)
MKPLPVVCVFALSSLLAPGQTSTTDVGSGAPNDSVRYSFGAAYYRNRFSTLVSLPPLGDVKKFGATGLVQEFPDAAKTTGVRYALIKPNTAVQAADGSDVFQLTGILYAYYSSVGVTTAGQPTSDYLNCADGLCQYQFYDKNYALFAYFQGLQSGQNFTLRDPFYTKWISLGGMSSLGAANSAETAVSSVVSSGAATLQTYSRGALYNITSGSLTGRLIPVTAPVYDLYVANGAHAGFLGFPSGEPVSLPGGGHRQNFEGGSIDYSDSGTPVLRLPVGSVQISSGGSSARLNLGDTVSVRASVYGANGTELADRSITFVTSNSRVISVQQSGSAATLRAVAGGTAKITAVSEGKTSAVFTIFVSAPCCDIGEGAPSAAAQQIFIDAVNRSRIAVRLPAANPVRRVGSGLVQEFQGVEPNTAVRYLVGVADRAAIGYVVTGDILTKYEQQGGPAQAMGYPIGDVLYDTARIGRQLFEGGAIAGNAVRVVAGAFLQKWALLNYESGVMGQPTGDVDGFVTFTGTSGRSQSFQNGSLYGAGAGPQAGKVYFISGLIGAKYNSIGAARGQLGLPVTDEFATAGKRRQEFEGGYLEYTAGDTEAKLTVRDRKPSITTTPATVAAGTRVHITIGGFGDAAALRVSVTGQTDFVVKTQTGSYFWDSYVPAGLVSGVIKVHAVDTASSSAVADGTYSVISVADLHAQIVKLGGDTQTASPGSKAPQSLRVAVRDDSGNPLAGVAVKFSASSGAQVAPPTAITDSLGQAETFLRLPLTEGIVLANAEAVRQVATFSARSVRSSLTNYPKLTQSGDVPLGNGKATIAQKGALLTAAASILRYYQNRGDLGMPNGVADPGVLNQFLKSLCFFDAQGVQNCDGFVSPKNSQEQFVNLWRLADFASNSVDVSIEAPDLTAIRDLLAQDSPVLLALALTSNGVPAGAHFVVAIGVAADGSILIHDPNPAFGRTSLTEYLSGFPIEGSNWTGTVAGALRLLPRSPTGTGFVIVSSNEKISIISQAGDCGVTLRWPNTAATATGAVSPTGYFSQKYCDGGQTSYQIDITGSDPSYSVLTDLGSLGSKVDLATVGVGSLRATRPGPKLVIGPQDINFSSRSVVNAATYTTDMAPGGLISIFGDGLAKRDTATKVEIGNIAARVTVSFPFQVNLQIPPEVQPGTQILRVTSPFGVSEQTIEVQAVAPAIFRLDPLPLGLDKTAANKGATINQDGKLNLPSNPARRGSIVTLFGTGFGAVNTGKVPSSTVLPVTGLLSGQEAVVSFAGLTPGFIGLYQVNVTIPLTAPPGLEIPISFRTGGAESSPVEIAVQ